MVGGGRSGQSTHVCFAPVRLQITPVSVRSASSAYTCQAKRGVAQPRHLACSGIGTGPASAASQDDVEGKGRRAAGRYGQPTSRVPMPLPYMW
jgi:hypothetical protein